MNKVLLFLFVVMLFSACSTDPEPINYGSDMCVFCDMNIVDKAHSAQYVSDKGKQFKYDAIECLIRDVVRNDITEIAHILVADYSSPGEMLNAEEAWYIISEEIKSPMGANLSAVATEAHSKDILTKYTGDVYIWSEIKPKIAAKKK